jgi:hypothetical protein
MLIFCVADPGCIYRIPDQSFPNPDHGSKRFQFSDPDSHQRFKVFLTQKNCFEALGNMARDVQPGSETRFFSRPGSRIRIRNTGNLLYQRYTDLLYFGLIDERAVEAEYPLSRLPLVFRSTAGRPAAFFLSSRRRQLRASCTHCPGSCTHCPRHLFRVRNRRNGRCNVIQSFTVGTGFCQAEIVFCMRIADNGSGFIRMFSGIALFTQDGPLFPRLFFFADLSGRAAGR